MIMDQLSELLSLGKGAPIEYDTRETFIDAFLRQVMKTPDATAVVDEFGSISYNELNRSSDVLASELLSDGIKSGDFVAVKLPRVKEFLVAVIGIWKAGAAYLPVDPTYPEDRINYMLEDSGAKLVIYKSWLERLRNAASYLSVPVNFARPDGTAIIMYTSGSTGRPKGVMSLHRSVNVLCSWMPEVMEFDPLSKVAEFPSFSFIFSCTFLYPPLVSGSEIHILSESVKNEMSLLNNYIRYHRIRQIGLVSDLAVEFIKSFQPDNLIILTGGEVLPRVMTGNTRLILSYGMSETMQAVTTLMVSDQENSGTALLGHPVPGVTIVLEDEKGNPVPRGEIGEICIASPQVAAGYWNREELTSRMFIERPWSEHKVLRTGDLARWNDDGVLEFHGRKDEMVKVRGNRVEFGEVEAVLMKVNGIRAAAAAMKEVSGASLLCGYYVADTMITDAVLRSALGTLLPPYMIPSLFVRMESLPKLPNGKLDRLSLPVPMPNGKTNSAFPEHDWTEHEEYIAPKTRIETWLCNIIATQLGIERIGMTNSLQKSGMTSLSALKLTVAFQQYGCSINLNGLLHVDTVRDLCYMINNSFDISNIGSWLLPYNNKKKTIVLCCGLIKAELLTCRLSNWLDEFNIYILQPLFSSWPDIEDISYEELLTRYFNFMQRDLTSVSCLMGFSFGGELAYHLATRWNSYTGQLPMVFMGDTTLKLPEIEISNQPSDYSLDIHYGFLIYQFIHHLGRLPLKSYNGHVILISAVGNGMSSIENEQLWKKVNTNIHIEQINDNHIGIAQNCEYYQKYLDMILNGENHICNRIEG